MSLTVNGGSTIRLVERSDVVLPSQRQVKAVDEETGLTIVGGNAFQCLVVLQRKALRPSLDAGKSSVLAEGDDLFMCVRQHHSGYRPFPRFVHLDLPSISQRLTRWPC